MVQVLYEYGANSTLCDVHQRTPLHYAAMSAYELRDIISILVQREFSFADRWGLTPLHYLIYRKHNTMTNLFTSSKHGCNMCIVYDIRRSVLEHQHQRNRSPSVAVPVSPLVSSSSSSVVSVATDDMTTTLEIREVPQRIVVPATAWVYRYVPPPAEADSPHSSSSSGGGGGSNGGGGDDEEKELDGTEINNLNRYGFYITEEENKEMSEEQRRTEERLSLEWSRYLKDWERSLQRKDLWTRCEQGIPDGVRGEVWKAFLNVRELAARQPYTYRLLATATARPETALQIDLDIKRSHMDHAFFSKHYSRGQVAMFDVMRAYSLYDPVVGYTQGMSDIAGFLLMYMQEEEAFWAFTQLMFDPAWHMQQFFTDGFPQLECFSYVQNRLLEKNFPKIIAHMRKVEFDPYAIQPHAMEWYMDLFIRILPFEYVIRIMDVLMSRGIAAIFCFAMAIFEILSEDILKTDSFPYLMRDLKNPYPLFPRKSPSDKNSTLSPDDFVKIAMNTKVTPKKVEKYIAEFPAFKSARMSGKPVVRKAK